MKRGQVVSGMRSGSNAPILDGEEEPLRADVIQELEDKRAALRGPVEEGVEFQSRSRNLRLSMRLYRPMFVDGEKIQDRDKNVQFHDYVFRTNEPKVIAWLRSLREFGVGRLFWETKELTAVLATNKIREAVDAIRVLTKDNPAALEALSVELGKGDFDILKAVAGAAAKTA